MTFRIHPVAERESLASEAENHPVPSLEDWCAVSANISSLLQPLYLWDAVSLTDQRYFLFERRVTCSEAVIRESESSLYTGCVTQKTTPLEQSLVESTQKALGLHEYLRSRVASWGFPPPLAILRYLRLALLSFFSQNRKPSSSQW
jgi:hypothetical protein